MRHARAQGAQRRCAARRGRQAARARAGRPAAVGAAEKARRASRGAPAQGGRGSERSWSSSRPARTRVSVPRGRRERRRGCSVFGSRVVKAERALRQPAAPARGPGLRAAECQLDSNWEPGRNRRAAAAAAAQAKGRRRWTRLCHTRRGVGSSAMTAVVHNAVEVEELRARGGASVRARCAAASAGGAGRRAQGQQPRARFCICGAPRSLIGWLSSG